MGRVRQQLLALLLALCLVLSGCQAAKAEPAETEPPETTSSASQGEPAADISAVSSELISSSSMMLAAVKEAYEQKVQREQAEIEEQKAAEEAAAAKKAEEEAAQKAAEEAAAKKAAEESATQTQPIAVQQATGTANDTAKANDEAAAKKAAEEAAKKAAEEAAAKKAAEEAALKTSDTAKPTVKEETGSNYLDKVEANVLKKVNAERVANGLNELILDVDLRSAARIRSKELYKNDHWDHTRPNGDPWYTVLDTEVPYPYLVAGENLAYCNYNDPSITWATSSNFWFTEWVNSPSHYQNMLRDTYTHAGVGIYCIEKGGMTYAYATMIFADPA